MSPFLRAVRSSFSAFKLRLWLAFSVCLLPGLALAQAIDPEAPDALVKLLVDAVSSRNWPLVVAVGVVLVVSLARKFLLPKLGQRWPVLLDKRVTLALVVLVSAGATIGGALLLGTPLSLGLVIGAVITSALSAVGLFSGAKNALQGGAPAPAQPTGPALSAIIGREPGQGFRGPQP